MLVKDVMCRQLITVAPSETIRACAHKMSQLNIGTLPIEENGKMVGFVTDRDICCRVVGRDRDPNTTLVKEIMTNFVRFCFEDEGCDKAVALMKSEHLRRLPVMNRAHRMVGLLSVDDIAHYSHDLAGKVLDSSSNVCGD
jgi:predicted transcriptional regulator